MKRDLDYNLLRSNIFYWLNFFEYFVTEGGFLGFFTKEIYEVMRTIRNEILRRYSRCKVFADLKSNRF